MFYSMRFVGDFICKYSSKTTVDASSSHVYAVQTAKGWFDAEVYDGTNIGRFANQQGVIRTLQMALEQGDSTKFVSMDWKVVNDFASSLANAKFVVTNRELHVVADEDIPPSTRRTEIFVCYGPVADYWIPLIAAEPDDFPSSLSSIVKELLTSPNSNWTVQEKENWSGLTLQQIEETFPR